MGPLLIAWSLSALGQATSVDWASGANLRWGGGLMAIEPNEPSVPATELSATLLAGMRVANERTSLVLRYRPTYYYQLPNATNSDWPLFLHSGDAELISALGPRTNLDWSFNSTVGEVNYSSLLRLLPDGTAATAASFLPVAFLSTTAGLNHELNRIHTWRLALAGNYRTSIGVDRESTSSIPTTVNVSGQLSDQIHISPRNEASVSVGFAQLVASTLTEEVDGTSVLRTPVLSTDVTWLHRFSKLRSLATSIGASASGLRSDETFMAFPTASLAYVGSSRAFRSTWNSRMSGGARGFVDPLLATFRPQGFVSFDLQGQHPGRFLSSTSATLSVPLAQDALQPAQYESTAMFMWMLSYELLPTSVLFLGTNWQIRAGHWSQPGAISYQNQIIGFVGLRFRLGTGQSRGNWL